MVNQLEGGFEKLSVDGDKSVKLDWAITTKSNRLVACSFFDRSAELVKGVGAAICLRHSGFFFSDTKKQFWSPIYGDADYKFYSVPMGGFDGFTQELIVLDPKKAKICFAQEGEEGKVFYNYLMEHCDLPLLPEWGDALLAECRRLSCCYFDGSRTGDICLYTADEETWERCVPLNGGSCKLKDLKVLKFPDDEWLANQLPPIVEKLIKSRAIRVTDKPQKHFDFETMDDYMKVHGTSLVDNLSAKIKPLSELSPEADCFTTVARPLYPQQVAMVNGVTALLSGTGNRKERRKTRSRYAILNEGMGCGKTLQAAAMCEALAVSKEVRKGRKLEDIYSVEDESINYRVIVMCPGHLTQKWAREIESDVPYAHVEVITDFAQLVRLKARGAERKGREFYIMSKDKAKLDAMEEPAVVRWKTGPVMSRRCANPKCKIYNGREVHDKTCPECGGKKFILRKSRMNIHGMVCPSCGNVCIPYKKFSWDVQGLLPGDFAVKRDVNAFCMYCGESLWQPRVKNLLLRDQEPKKRSWQRMTMWANEAKKGKVTIWVHNKMVQKVQDRAINFIEAPGCRRTAPAHYIKNHMKGFFDVAIFDEVHTLKGGDTAQGQAMHALCKASKYQLALTGTIAGGYADHLFYLLWRLDPKRMKDAGYDFTSRLKFIEKYGSLETTYDGDVRYNKMSRGRVTSQPKCKPGISPRIFTDFLLDKAVFLDVTDLSKYLPPLKEQVVLVPMERTVENEYTNDLSVFQELAHKQGLGMRLMSTQLQFSLSYPDKPYGRLPILDPRTGEKLLEPANLIAFSEAGVLLPKEERLIEILNKELEEGRNAFVYAEYTGMAETRISERLRDLIITGCDLKKEQVAILDSEKVDASKREEWIAGVAVKGARVIITNPKCVETGLDFCFKAGGKDYNYPTIVFFQMGYSLFTIWQASRRHYRLNQRLECRTYYMGYEGTTQAALIGLVAKKMSATSAIQGKFSSEGLSAMAQGVDARVALAQAMSNMDFSTENNLQQMFDVVAAENDPRYEGAKRMRLLAEIVPVEIGRNSDSEADTFFFDEETTGNDESEAAQSPETFDDFFGWFDSLFGVGKAADAEECSQNTNTGTANTELSVSAEPAALVIKAKKKRRNMMSNQASFF